MPPLSPDINKKKPVKMMLVGHSGAGKTGALTSLVKAGYRIRILDLDNGLDSLINHVMTECPERIGQIDYMSFRDSYKMGPTGPMVQGTPKAYTNAMRALDKWEDGSIPAQWGTNTILVIDSLTNLGRAAFAWAQQMQPQVREPRQWYNVAQDQIEKCIATATAEDFDANLIVMSHIDLVEMPDKTVQGFASSIGKAFGPKLPRYFNTFISIETQGQGKNVKRILKTLPTGLMTLKNPAPMKVEAEYPISDGLAKIFAALKS